MRRVAEGSRFYYDGTQEIAEYTLDTFPLTNGTIKKRFIRLPGSVDAPFLMINYEAGNCTAGNSSNFTACERWGSLGHGAPMNERNDVRLRAQGRTSAAAWSPHPTQTAPSSRLTTTLNTEGRRSPPARKCPSATPASVTTRVDWRKAPINGLISTGPIPY